MKKSFYFVISMIVFLLLLQIVRIFIRKFFLLFIPTTYNSLLLLNLIIIILMICALIYLCNKNNIDLNLFKVKSKRAYILLSILYLFVILIFVLIYKIRFIDVLYSVIALPIFEELLFRGYLWNRTKKVFKKNVIVYFVIVILFLIWNIGYIDSLILVSKLNNISFSFNMIIGKLVIALIYGLLIGFVKYKTNNTYLSILLHSFLNIFIL